MISDISSSRPMFFPINRDLSKVLPETAMPKGSFLIVSNPRIGYLLPFFLQNCPSRLDSYRTNVVIQEDAT